MFVKAAFGCIPQAQLHPAGFLPAVAASLTTSGKNGAVTRRRDPVQTSFPLVQFALHALLSRPRHG